MILYNGASGGLGRHFGPALCQRKLQGQALLSRLEDRSGLRRELAGLAPRGEVILVQMAARVSVPACEADPEGAHAINVVAARDTVLDFVDWAESLALRPCVLYVSSGHVYAAAPPGVRLAEAHPTAPRSVYARTKLLAEEELQAAAARRGFRLLVARVFGLLAPGQPLHYVLPGLIRRVRESRLSGVPGLSNVRDYLDARDACQDLISLSAVAGAERWRGAVVNVCSGRGVAVRELLQEVVRVLRPAEDLAVMTAAVEAPGRPDDVPWSVGDPSRFVDWTGEQPVRIPLRDTVRDACESFEHA